MSITIRSVAGADLYVAKTATDVREALQEAVQRGANLRGAYLARAYLGGATGINPHRVNELLMLRDQPGPIRAYKLVDGKLRSPIQSTGKLTFAIGSTVTAPSVDADETVQCGAGISLATLPWCMREWRPGWRILLVEFTAADIVAIPIGDGKFRVRACRVVGEKDLVELGLVERPA